MPVRMDKLRHGWGATENGRRTASAILDHVSALPRRPDPWPPSEGSSQKDILAHAVETVGSHSGTGLTLADFAMSVLPGLRGDADFWATACERASVADALCSSAGAEKVRHQVLAASLLENVGQCVLREFLPKAYARVLTMAENERLPIHAAERFVLGIDRAEVGRMVLSHWSVHPAIVDGVGLRHHSAELLGGLSPHARIAAMLQLAELASVSGRSRRASISDLCRIASVEPGEIDGVVGRARGACETLADVLTRIRNGDARGIPSVETAGGGVHLTPWLTPLMTFAVGASPSDAPGAVVGRILNCLVEAIPLSKLVVFLIDRDRRSYVCASRAEGRDIAERFAMVGDDNPGSEIPATFLGGPLLYAPPMAGSVRDRYRHRFGQRLPLMLPLKHGTELVGGVLLDEDGASALASTMSVESVRLAASVFATAAWSVLRSESAVQSLSALAGIHESVVRGREEQVRERATSMIAEMAAGAGHELNNPLAVISGRAQMLARSEDGAGAKQSLELIREQCDIATGIVNDLVAVAKPDPPVAGFSTLAAVFSGVEQRWGDRLAGVGGRLVVVPADADVRVWVDSGHLERVLDELMANAIESIAQENGVVQINSRSMPSDDMIVIVIRDNGYGMSEGVLDRAFDPFFSHQLAGRRRGLGLSLARRLSQINGGSLWLESTVDVGTTAYLELPARG